MVQVLGFLMVKIDVLSYEHAERQRQGPLESIVTLENGGGG